MSGAAREVAVPNTGEEVREEGPHNVGRLTIHASWGIGFPDSLHLSIRTNTLVRCQNDPDVLVSRCLPEVQHAPRRVESEDLTVAAVVPVTARRLERERPSGVVEDLLDVEVGKSGVQPALGG